MQQQYPMPSDAQQQEDGALKTSMHFFADELLPYLHIPGKVVSFAPTELVHLDLQKLYQDFNLVMEDGSWKHFEFQSTNEGLVGLKRFRAYEALTSYQHKVEVTTYVLYSGTIKRPMTEFTEGINTYRVHPIIMQDEDADQLIAKLQRKIEAGEPLTKQDIVPLTLCPLMGGTMTQKERIKATYEIMRQVTDVPPEEIRKIEAVIYAMADKFLESMDLDEIMEDISMTRLGRKLVNKGIYEGENENKLKNAKNLLDLLDEQTIAERIGLPLETVRQLKKEQEDAKHNVPKE
ncbi:MAG: hypothetical protein J6C37_06830 [Roseburia sp.]|nr:hypothetical protein [Roseburia sp.]